MASYLWFEERVRYLNVHNKLNSQIKMDNAATVEPLPLRRSRLMSGFNLCVRILLWSGVNYSCRKVQLDFIRMEGRLGMVMEL